MDYNKSLSYSLNCCVARLLTVRRIIIMQLVDELVDSFAVSWQIILAALLVLAEQLCSVVVQVMLAYF